MELKSEPVMAFQITDDATDQAVRKLAKTKGKSLTDTVREAVESEYVRLHAEIPLIERLKVDPGGIPKAAATRWFTRRQGVL